VKLTFRTWGVSVKVNKCFKVILLIPFIMLVLGSRICAYEMRYPFRGDNGNDRVIQKTENFGAYRKYSNGYEEFHKGIDLSTSRNTKIYPIAAGTIVSVGYNGHGYGYTVVIDHGGWQSYYSHLRGPREFPSDDKITSEEKILRDYITSEGGKIPGMGPHFHFGLGVPNAETINTRNPIREGLKQPKYGRLRFVEDPEKYRKIRPLATGSDETFGGENEMILSNAKETINHLGERKC